MTRTLTEREQEVVIIRSRDKKNVLEIAVSDIRVIKKVLKHYESNITQKVYNESYRAVFKDGLVEIFLELDVQDFKRYIFFPKWRGSSK